MKFTAMARRLGTSLEALLIEAMMLTGRRGVIVGMGVEEQKEEPA